MDNIVTAAQNSATDFGFSRMVYSYARQLRMERKKYPDQHTDVGGMRQVVLDIVRSVRRAARIRRFLRGIVYERGARDSATEGRQQKLKLLRSGDEEGSDYDSDDGGGRKKKKGRGGLRRGKGKKNAGGSSSRNRAGVGSDGSGHNDDDDLAGSNQLLIGGGLSEGEELGGSQPAGSGLGMSGSTHGDGVSGGGLGEKKRRKKGGGDNSQADADENSKVTQSRSKPRCFTMMDEACENVTPTSPIKSLLELHALLKLIEPRMHEFRGLSVSFWRSLNHLLRCCQDRERWGRDMDTVEEIQMYWIGVVEQFEGRVVRRGGCRHDKVPNIDSFYDKIGASDELAESDGEGLGRENVEKVLCPGSPRDVRHVLFDFTEASEWDSAVMVYAYHVKGMQGRPRNRQFRPPWLRPPLGLKQLPMDESMPICQSSQHHHLEQFSTREWSFIDDILDLNTDAAEAIARLSVLGGEHFRTLNDRTGFCHD